MKPGNLVLRYFVSIKTLSFLILRAKFWRHCLFARFEALPERENENIKFLEWESNPQPISLYSYACEPAQRLETPVPEICECCSVCIIECYSEWHCTRWRSRIVKTSFSIYVQVYRYSFDVASWSTQ